MEYSKVRIREHFGLVSNDSHTEKFSFLISPPKSRAGLEEGNYILVDHPIVGEAIQVLAIINDINSYEEMVGSTVNDRKGKMLATAKALGGIDIRTEQKPLLELHAPPNPGSRIHIPSREFLEDILNRNVDGQPYKLPTRIGTLEGLSAEESQGKSKIECYIDLQELLERHTLIAAVAGAGKTYLAMKIAKAIQEKATTKMVVFDAYGEYMQVTGCSFNIKMYEESLIRAIASNKSLSLNGSGLGLDEKRRQFTETLKALLKLRLEEKIPPMLLILEEAENFKGEVLEEAVAIGKKCGLILCLLATHPTELGGRVLSEFGNKFIGRITDKTDLERFYEVTSIYPLAKLTIGEWIISGISNARPLKVSVN